MWLTLPVHPCFVPQAQATDAVVHCGHCPPTSDTAPTFQHHCGDLDLRASDQPPVVGDVLWAVLPGVAAGSLDYFNVVTSASIDRPDLPVPRLRLHLRKSVLLIQPAASAAAQPVLAR